MDSISGDQEIVLIKNILEDMQIESYTNEDLDFLKGKLHAMIYKYLDRIHEQNNFRRNYRDVENSQGPVIEDCDVIRAINNIKTEMNTPTTMNEYKSKTKQTRNGNPISAYAQLEKTTDQDNALPMAKTTTLEKVYQKILE